MENGFLDIILFAMIAGFLILRLRSVLGRRTGHERQRPDPYASTPRGQGAEADNVLDFPHASRSEDLDLQIEENASPVAAGLTRIRIADPSFDPNGFLGGARAAFEMIVGAYAAGDEQSLRPLLSDEVFDNFKRAIDTRRANGEEMLTEIVAIKSAEIVDAEMKGSNALVTVKFVSEQVNALRDSEGNVIEGSIDYINTVIDVWTFRRDTRSSDPNWFLVETRTPETEGDEEEGE